MQSRNRLRRDSIIVEFAKPNLDRLCVNQSGSKLLFNELQNIIHSHFDAINIAPMSKNFGHSEVTCPKSCRAFPPIKHCHPDPERVEAKDRLYFLT
jgi:hypothetical protein